MKRTSGSSRLAKASRRDAAAALAAYPRCGSGTSHDALRSLLPVCERWTFNTLTAQKPHVGFECDERKSRANKAKHGIDFVETQALWHDEALAETLARSDTEERFLVVRCVAGRHWSAFIAYRGEAVRLISVRRSRPEEVAIYEGR